MVLAFLAEMAGTLVGTLLNPILWAIAFGLSLLRWGRPWLAITLAAVTGAIAYALTGYGFSMAFWPVIAGQAAAAILMVVAILAVQSVRRARRLVRG